MISIYEKYADFVRSFSGWCDRVLRDAVVRRASIVGLILYVGTTLFWASPAYAAIALDTSFELNSGNSVSVSPAYYSATIGASATAICVGNQGAVSASDSTTNVEIGTISGTSTATREGGAQAPSDRYEDAWCLLNPPTGAHVTIKITFTGTFASSYASSYSGVGSIDGASTATHASASSFALPVTTTVNNAWAWSVADNANAGPTAGTGTTLRQTNAGGGMSIGDSNGAIATAGSYTMNWSQGTSGTWAGTIVALEPPVAAAAAPFMPFLMFFGQW